MGQRLTKNKEREDQGDNLRTQELTVNVTNLQRQLTAKNEQVTNLQRQLSAKNEQVTNLQRQQSASNEQVTDLQRQLSAKNEQVTDLERVLTARNEQVTDLQRQQSASNQQVTDLQRQLTASNEQVTDLQRQLPASNEQHTNLQKQQLANNEQVTDLQRQLSAKNEQVSDLERVLTATNEQDTKLQRRDTAWKEEATNLRRTLSANNEQVTDLKRQLSARNEQVTNLQRQHSASNEQITDLQSQLSAKNEQVTDLQSQLSAENEQVSYLERQFNRSIEFVTCTLAGTNSSENIAEMHRDWEINRNEIITIPGKVLGRGAWGRVTEGKFRRSKVAVKEIHEAILSPHNRMAFEREMKIASRCRHPCLLQFIGATNDEEGLLLVTELMDRSLRSLYEERPLTEREISVISLDVAQALNYLHQNKPDPIIHRDISSSNVLLWRQGDEWRGKVSDYGTANFVRQCGIHDTGAVTYCAPEAFERAQDQIISCKVDVYSFGVLLCEMHIRELPDPQQREAQISRMPDQCRFLGIVVCCVQIEPGRRPNVEEIIHDLEK